MEKRRHASIGETGYPFNQFVIRVYEIVASWLDAINMR
jgi:hypothetical protein